MKPRLFYAVTGSALRLSKSAIGNRVFAALVCLLLASLIAFGQSTPSPFLIPFQGRLTNPQGVPYTNGQYTVIFNLYNQPVGGTVLWSETHQKVGVVNGMVNVFLGSINPALNSVDFSQTRHLGITIDADGNPNTPDPEMVPRQMIIPAFWAKNSEKLAGYDWTQIFGANSPVGQIPGGKIQNQSISTSQIANGAVTASQIAAGAVIAAIANGTIQGQQIAAGGLTVSNFSAQLILDTIIPPGTIMAFGGTNIPNGWLLCDGRVLSSSQFPRLFSVISTSSGNGTSGGIVGTNDFNLPDLQGMFLRGADNGIGQDPDAASRSVAVGFNPVYTPGSRQGDMFRSHTHNFVWGAGGINGENSPYSVPIFNQGFNNTFTTSANGGSETRPYNVYVNYIIKY